MYLSQKQLTARYTPFELLSTSREAGVEFHVLFVRVHVQMFQRLMFVWMCVGWDSVRPPIHVPSEEYTIHSSGRRGRR